MTLNNNFKWITSDIDNTLVLKVIYSDDKREIYGVFNVVDVLETTGDEIDIKTANIDDLTRLLTMGIVRFVNVEDSSDILDIPFRNLYLLYKNANVLGVESEIKTISFNELDIFSIIDGTIRNESLLIASVISDISSDLDQLMKIAYEFGSYGMKEKIDALNNITLINHRRLIKDEQEKSYNFNRY